MGKKKEEVKKGKKKLTQGDIAFNASLTFPALNKLFDLTFKDFEMIEKITDLRREVVVIRDHYNELLQEIVKAHGQKNEAGADEIAVDNPAFNELLAKEVDIKSPLIKIDRDVFRQAVSRMNVPFNANDMESLRPFVKLVSKKPKNKKGRKG